MDTDARQPPIGGVERRTPPPEQRSQLRPSRHPSSGHGRVLHDRAHHPDPPRRPTHARCRRARTAPFVGPETGRNTACPPRIPHAAGRRTDCQPVGRQLIFRTGVTALLGQRPRRQGDPCAGEQPSRQRRQRSGTDPSRRAPSRSGATAISTDYIQCSPRRRPRGREGHRRKSTIPAISDSSACVADLQWNGEVDHE